MAVVKQVDPDPLLRRRFQVFCIENDEFCINSNEFRINNDELGIGNQLDKDQIIVQDDPDFTERFIPLQVADLCERLAFECRDDRAFQENFAQLSGLIRKLIYVRMYTSAKDAFQLYSRNLIHKTTIFIVESRLKDCGFLMRK